MTPNEYLAALKAELPGMTADQLRDRLDREHTALLLRARFDTRPAAAIRERLQELGEDGAPCA